MAKLIFDIPPGFKVPEDTQDGQEFDSVTTLKLEDGKLCLVAVDGVDLPGYDEDDKKEERPKPDESDDFIGAMEKGMSGAPAGPPMVG